MNWQYLGKLRQTVGSSIIPSQLVEVSPFVLHAFDGEMDLPPDTSFVAETAAATLSLRKIAV
jgi:hypothetical protein